MFDFQVLSFCFFLCAVASLLLLMCHFLSKWPDPTPTERRITKFFICIAIVTVSALTMCIAFEEFGGLPPDRIESSGVVAVHRRAGDGSGHEVSEELIIHPKKSFLVTEEVDDSGKSRTFRIHQSGTWEEVK